MLIPLLENVAGMLTIIQIPGIEYQAPDLRIHLEAEDTRLHFQSPDTRPHYESDEQ